MACAAAGVGASSTDIGLVGAGRDDPPTDPVCLGGHRPFRAVLSGRARWGRAGLVPPRGALVMHPFTHGSSGCRTDDQVIGAHCDRVDPASDTGLGPRREQAPDRAARTNPPVITERSELRDRACCINIVENHRHPQTAEGRRLLAVGAPLGYASDGRYSIPPHEGCVAGIHATGSITTVRAVLTAARTPGSAATRRGPTPTRGARMPQPRCCGSLVTHVKMRAWVGSLTHERMRARSVAVRLDGTRRAGRRSATRMPRPGGPW